MHPLLRQIPRTTFVVLVGVICLLVWAHVLDVVVLAILEVLLLVVAFLSIGRMWRRYRSARAEGIDVWQALEGGLAVMLPRRVARFVALEPRIWFCLFRWVFRRRSPDACTFGYSKGSSVGVFVIAVLFSAPVETLLFELLIPWHWLKVLFLILDIYSLIWLLGFAASLAVLPHRMTVRGIHIYYGIGAHGFLPYATIASVRRQRLMVSGRDGCHVDAERQTASISVGGVTTVTLHVRQPVTLRRIFDSTPPIATLHLAVDEPERFVNALERHLAEQQAPLPAQAGVVPLATGRAQ